MSPWEGSGLCVVEEGRVSVASEKCDAYMNFPSFGRVFLTVGPKP